MEALTFSQGDVDLEFEECELIDAIRIQAWGDGNYLCSDLTRDEATELRDWLTEWLAAAKK